MTGRDGARVLAIPPAAVRERPIATLQDVDATLDPDAVWLHGPSREPQAFARARRVFDAPTFHPPLETAASDEPVTRRTVGDGEVATVAGAGALEAAPDALASALAGPDTVALVCDDVTTTVRPTTLETTLEHDAALATALPAGRATTVLSGGLPADYDERWRLEAGTGAVRTVDHDPELEDDSIADDAVAVRLRGAGPVEGYGRSTSVAVLELGPDGVAAVETRDLTDFGLEAVAGVGPKTAERLVDRDVTTRGDLLETPVEALADCPGVGRDGARRMHHHATVLETGEPRRLTDDSLPGEDWHRPPLCLDVETDGLSPTILWQIGVYDPETDDYRAFVEREDPDDPAPVLEAFCDWLLGVHPNRALLTWNGWRFDYRHLGAFVARHCPYYAEEWEAVPKFDLYGWAVRNDNAVLPGRTNELDVVADALGYEDAGTGLDGARTAAAYQRFARTGDQLDWERHEAYCEDDCRALWHVYERLREAPRAERDARRTDDGSNAAGPPAASASDSRSRDGSEPSTTDADRSEQTGLGDF